MNQLKIDNQQVTLVDQVENQLLKYFKINNMSAGSPIPNESALAESLGVGRSVLREALSRLKMLGLIDTRTRKGMQLKEPPIFGTFSRIIDPHLLSENTIFDILGFRTALELGISSDIFENITSKDIEDLEQIVKVSEILENNEYPLVEEWMFHSKLYEITNNKLIAEFQTIIHPIMVYVKETFVENIQPINIDLSSKGLIVTHSDLLSFIKNKDLNGYKKAIEQHLVVYKILAQNRKTMAKLVS